MPRRTPVNELLQQGAESAVSSPLRRSSRISSSAAQASTPAKAPGRRSSTDTAGSTPIPKIAKTRRASYSQETETEKEKAEGEVEPKPTPRGRKGSVSKTLENDEADGEKAVEGTPSKARTRRSSVSKDEPISEPKTPARRRRSSSVDVPPEEQRVTRSRSNSFRVVASEDSENSPKVVMNRVSNQTKALESVTESIEQETETEPAAGRSGQKAKKSDPDLSVIAETSLTEDEEKSSQVSEESFRLPLEDSTISLIDKEKKSPSANSDKENSVPVTQAKRVSNVFKEKGRIPSDPVEPMEVDEIEEGEELDRGSGRKSARSLKIDRRPPISRLSLRKDAKRSSPGDPDTNLRKTAMEIEVKRPKVPNTGISQDITNMSIEGTPPELIEDVLMVQVSPKRKIDDVTMAEVQEGAKKIKSPGIDLSAKSPKSGISPEVHLEVLKLNQKVKEVEESEGEEGSLKSLGVDDLEGSPKFRKSPRLSQKLSNTNGDGKQDGENGSPKDEVQTGSPAVRSSPRLSEKSSRASPNLSLQRKSLNFDEESPEKIENSKGSPNLSLGKSPEISESDPKESPNKSLGKSPEKLEITKESPKKSESEVVNSPKVASVSPKAVTNVSPKSAKEGNLQEVSPNDKRSSLRSSCKITDFCHTDLESPGKCQHGDDPSPKKRISPKSATKSADKDGKVDKTPKSENLKETGGENSVEIEEKSKSDYESPIKRASSRLAGKVPRFALDDEEQVEKTEEDEEEVEESDAKVSPKKRSSYRLSAKLAEGTEIENGDDVDKVGNDAKKRVSLVKMAEKGELDRSGRKSEEEKEENVEVTSSGIGSRGIKRKIESSSSEYESDSNEDEDAPEENDEEKKKDEEFDGDEDETSLDRKIKSLIARSLLEKGDQDDSEEEPDVRDFLDGECEEGEEDTPSEDSNQIIDEGESIGSESDVNSLDDAHEEDDSSFIDDDVDVNLLPGDEYDLDVSPKRRSSRIRNLEKLDSDEEVVKIEPKEKKKTPKVSPRKRIIVPDDSSDEEVGEKEVKKAQEPVEIEEDAPEAEEKEVATEKEVEKEEDAFEIDDVDSEPEEVASETEEVASETEEVASETEEAASETEEAASGTAEKQVASEPEVKKAASETEEVEIASESEEKENEDSSQKRKRTSSIIILENIRIDNLATPPMVSERISKVVEMFCSNIKTKGDVSVNVSFDYEQKSSDENCDDSVNKSRRPSTSKTASVTDLSDDVFTNGTGSKKKNTSKNISEESSCLEISVSDDDEVEVVEKPKEAKKKRRKNRKRKQSQAKPAEEVAEKVETPEIEVKKMKVDSEDIRPSTSKTSKSNRKSFELTKESSLNPASQSIKKRRKNRPKIKPGNILLQEETMNVLDQALKHGKNSIRVPSFKPSCPKRADSDWAVLDVKKKKLRPSKNNLVSQEELKPSTYATPMAQKFHPKDFKNRTLFDAKRVQRVDTKNVLMKLGGKKF